MPDHRRDFPETSRACLDSRVRRKKVLAHRPGILLAKAIVESLVVRLVEVPLLQRLLPIPVDFGHEDEVGDAFTHTAGRRRPKQQSELSPGSLEDFRQYRHSHICHG